MDSPLFACTINEYIPGLTFCGLCCHSEPLRTVSSRWPPPTVSVRDTRDWLNPSSATDRELNAQSTPFGAPMQASETLPVKFPIGVIASSYEAGLSVERVADEGEATSEKPLVPQLRTTPAWLVSWPTLSALICSPLAKANCCMYALNAVLASYVWSRRKYCKAVLSRSRRSRPNRRSVISAVCVELISAFTKSIESILTRVEKWV